MIRPEKRMVGDSGLVALALAGLKRAFPVCVVLSSFLLVALVPSGSTGQTTPCRAPNKMYEGQCLHPQKIAKLKKDNAKQQAEADSKAEAERKEAERQAGIVTWVRIRGGTFAMGSRDPDLFDYDKPVHSVTMPTFEMAETETTVAQYRKCVEAGACAVPGAYTLAEDEDLCNWGKSDRDSHPINCIDWEQAAAYAKWVGGRLPTEAEWEYAACSGGRDQKYAWGNKTATCAYAVINDGSGYGCGRDGTWPVCSKTSGNTAQGLCDMAGNVEEWVQDTWHNNYSGAPSNGSAWEESGSGRIRRGGSWISSARDVRAAARGGFPSYYRLSILGLRPARSVP